MNGAKLTFNKTHRVLVDDPILLFMSSQQQHSTKCKRQQQYHDMETKSGFGSVSMDTQVSIDGTHTSLNQIFV